MNHYSAWRGLGEAVYVNQICSKGKQRPLLRFSSTQLRQPGQTASKLVRGQAGHQTDHGKRQAVKTGQQNRQSKPAGKIAQQKCSAKSLTKPLAVKAVSGATMSRETLEGSNRSQCWPEAADLHGAESQEGKVKSAVRRVHSSWVSLVHLPNAPDSASGNQSSGSSPMASNMPLKLSCWSTGPPAAAGVVVWLVSGSRSGRAVQWGHQISPLSSAGMVSWRIWHQPASQPQPTCAPLSGAQWRQLRQLGRWAMQQGHGGVEH